jgi:hypothetical protein
VCECLYVKCVCLYEVVVCVCMHPVCVCALPAVEADACVSLRVHACTCVHVRM